MQWEVGHHAVLVVRRSLNPCNGYIACGRLGGNFGKATETLLQDSFDMTARHIVIAIGTARMVVGVAHIVICRYILIAFDHRVLRLHNVQLWITCLVLGIHLVIKIGGELV